ncbi:hypothetical protein B0T12DRAFT_480649 [Alternaria alternata]|nr:hypothetical protein B0T12DRAFT_480649 [Alternaria alternata]
MSSCRHNSAIKTADPLPQLQQQLRVCDSRFSILSQHEIDAIYTAEYGEPTQQDCNDFFLLFLGLHEDIMELQRELLEITARGADAMTIAPCFYGRLNVIMKERIETLASGKPLRVEGYPPTYPGPMMLRWVREYDIAMPSLYDRTEGLLAAKVQQSLFEAPTTSASTSTSTSLSATHAETETFTIDARRVRKTRQKNRKTAWPRSGK